MPLPDTPSLAPTVQPTPAPTLPAATEPPVAATPFTGTWKGPDPDDGSVIILTLVQTGSTLDGRFSDSYSGTIAPPGFEGPVSGTVLSDTTAQVTMKLSRHDGRNAVLQANLALSDQNTLTATATPAVGKPWVLKRQ
jgi:hypothetical protein